MNNLKINGVIKSNELVNIINTFRKEEGKTELQHNDFMKKIRKEIETLETLGLRGEGNFSLAKYSDKQGKERDCFELTHDGMLEMLNSESAYCRYKTIEYINNLQQQVQKQPKPLTPIQQLQLQSQAILEVNGKIDNVQTEVNALKDSMPLFSVECKDLQALVKKVAIQALGGDKSKPAYKNKSVRSKVFSDIQCQLRRQFGVKRYEGIKRKDLDTAKSIVESYQLPFCLEQEVTLANNQVIVGGIV